MGEEFIFCSEANSLRAAQRNEATSWSLRLEEKECICTMDSDFGKLRGSLKPCLWEGQSLRGFIERREQSSPGNDHAAG